MPIYPTAPIYQQSNSLQALLQNHKPALKLSDHSPLLYGIFTGNTIIQVSFLCNLWWKKVLTVYNSGNKKWQVEYGLIS